MTADGERRVVDGRLQWLRHGTWFELQAELAPDAVLPEPAAARGEVFRLRPFEVEAGVLARAAAGLGVEGQPVLEEDEWQIDDPRGYSLAVGRLSPSSVPKLVGGVRFPAGERKTGKGRPEVSPLGPWPKSATHGERVAFAIDLLHRIGVRHLEWAAAPPWDNSEAVILRPRVGDVVLGQALPGTGTSDYWAIGPDRAGDHLGSLNGRYTDLELVDSKALRSPAATFASFLRGDLAALTGCPQRAVRTYPTEPAHTISIRGVHLELVEHRYDVDGEPSIVLLPSYAYTGGHVAADGTDLRPSHAALWPDLDGMIYLPAVDLGPPVS